jgi:hypothetical protein
MDGLKESQELALSYILIGIAIGRDGDSKRITEWVDIKSCWYFVG